MCVCGGVSSGWRWSWSCGGAGPGYQVDQEEGLELALGGMGVTGRFNRWGQNQLQAVRRPLWLLCAGRGGGGDSSEPGVQDSWCATRGAGTWAMRWGPRRVGTEKGGVGNVTEKTLLTDQTGAEGKRDTCSRIWSCGNSPSDLNLLPGDETEALWFSVVNL